MTDLHSIGSFSICVSDLNYLLSYNFYTWRFLSFLYKENHLRWTEPLACISILGIVWCSTSLGRPLALGIKSGISLGIVLLLLCGTQSAEMLWSWWGHRLLFSHGFFSVQRRHDGYCMEAAASAAEIAAKQALRSSSLSHIIVLTSGRGRQRSDL